MKKLLTATTALALVGGAAFAEVTISGSAKLGIDYDSEAEAGMSKHSFKHDMGVSFSGSGTTDGGLSFGGTAGFDSKSGGGSNDEGSVFISGSFGKITIGDQDAADHLAGGIVDVGLNGQGVDDVVEQIRGQSAHQARYDHSVGNIALAISAGTDTKVDGTPNTGVSGTGGTLETKKNSYAIGMSFSASGATIGLGYDSMKTISAGFGYSTGQISASAFYAKGEVPYKHLGADGAVGGSNNDADGEFNMDLTGMGVDVSYTMGASKLTLVYAKTDVDNYGASWDTTNSNWGFAKTSLKGMGVGFSHDLGGGASLVAGFAQVPTLVRKDFDMDEIGQQANNLGNRTLKADPDDKNVASVGLSFSF